MAGDQGTASRVEYRRAVEADIEAEHAVFVAAEGELTARHGFGWRAPPPVEAIAPTLRHLLRTDAGRCLVAQAGDRIVGFGAAIVRGNTCFLGWLFIDPGYQGRGIGRRLLDLALEGAPERRITITGAIQPISNALYARFGMLPVTPMLEFEGDATSVDPPAGLVATAPDPGALARLDLAAYGFDRAVDHPYWATVSQPTLWLRSGEPVAYSYRRPNGQIGPLAGLDETGAADALGAELARQPTASLHVPGTSRSMVRAALAAGLRLQAPPGLLLLSDGIASPRSLAIGSYGLY